MAEKHPIWKFFLKKGGTAKCNICSKDLSLGSLEPKYQSVTNIKNHLQRTHKDSWPTYEKAYQKHLYSKMHRHKIDKRNIRTPRKPHKSEKSTKVTLPENIEPEKHVIWSDDHPISHSIDKAIMDLIIVDMLPYNIVEGDAFRRLNFADPDGPRKYRMKSEKYFRTTLMPSTYAKVKGKVSDLLMKATWISVTTEIWNNPSKSCSHLTFTAHFVQDDTRLKVVLGAFIIDSDLTGPLIAKKFTETINEFSIESKIHMTIRDNSPNMGAAMRVAKFMSIGCVAHTLQHVIHDAVFRDEDIDGVIKKCRNIVRHFKGNVQACRYLSEYQETCALPKHSLIQDNESRWNSTFIMMERLVEQKTAINLYISERGRIEALSAEEWKLIREMIVVLKCFYQATSDITADSASVSVIIPLIAMLNEKLAISDRDSETVRGLKESLCESLNRRFLYIKNGFTVPLAVATVLDPRFKTKYLTEYEVDKSKAEILNFLRNQFDYLASSDTKNNDSNPNLPMPSTSSSSSRRRAQSAKNYLWDSHDSMSTSQVPIKTTSGFPNFEHHLDAYLNEPIITRNGDVFKYWDSSPYTLLKPAAAKYLSAPPTSVTNEKLFKDATQIYADRKRNLLGEDASMLLFLVYNIKIFNFKY